MKFAGSDSALVVEPLFPPGKAKVPSGVTPVARKEGNVLKFNPVALGLDGMPVPSSQESSCIHSIANCPAAFALKIGLFGSAAVSFNEADVSCQPPTPK